MQERLFDGITTRQAPKKLILVLEQDEEIGAQFVQLIRQATPFQAILATTILEARTILGHQKCDVILLTDGTFPEDDLERLYLLPQEVKLPAPLDLTYLSSTYHRDKRDVEVIVKAVSLLLSLSDAPLGVHSPPDLLDHKTERVTER